MIHPAAVRAFLEAERDNHAWVKGLSDAQLDRELVRIGFYTPHPKRPLDKHQKACLLLGVAFSAFSYWLDMGTGKTRLALELLNYLTQQGEVRHALVLVPSEQSVYGWEKQIAEWKIPVPYVALGNSPSADKWSHIDELPVPGIILCTYPGLVWLLSKRKVKKSKGKAVVKKGKPVMRVTRQASLVDRLCQHLDMLVMDESTKLGHQGSLQYMAVRALRKRVGFYYNLAGRPFGRDPEMVWTQQWLVDFGASLGDTLTLFRQAFYKEKRGYFGGFEYTFCEAMRPRLAELMAHRSISYDEAECGSKTPVKVSVEEVRLPEDIESYYRKAAEAVRRARGNRDAMKNVFLRMRQLSSGFVGFRDDETGERAQITFPVNPKLERLVDLLEAMPRDRKFVIFHEFTHSGRVLCDKLKQMGIQHGWLYGGTKNSRAIQDRFDSDPKMLGLVVNSRLGAMSLNLQVANYQFDYENPVSVIDKEQMDKRLPRKGQTRTVYRYELVCAGTVDQKILDFHRSGEDLFQALLRDPYGVVGGKNPPFA